MLAMTKVLSLRGALVTLSRFTVFYFVQQYIRIESQNLDRLTEFAMTDFFPPKKILKKQKKRKKSDFLFYYLRNTSSHLIKNWCKKVFKNLLFKNFWLYLYRHSKEAKQIPCCDKKRRCCSLLLMIVQYHLPKKSFISEARDQDSWSFSKCFDEYNINAKAK